jgi:hypothetical protein
MARCEANGDCRAGYVCTEPTRYPWNAKILDDDQSKRSCLPAPLEGLDAASAPGTTNAPVCSASTVDAGHIEASAPSVDAAPPPVPPLFPDGGADAASPGPADAADDGG